MIVAYGSAWGIVAKGGMEVYTLRYLRWTCATLPFMETVCWYGATNGLFVHSSEFAAEWWGNIDGWAMIWCFWTLHETCMLVWDKVYGQQLLMWMCNSLAAWCALQVNWRCLWTTSFSFWLACSLSTTNQTNRPYLLPNCVLHFFRSCMSFCTTCLWRRWMFWEFEEEFWMWKWMVNSTQWIHPTGWWVFCTAAFFSRRNSRKKTT